MLRSFFVPKTITTMSNTMSQCQMLNEPMNFSPAEANPRFYGLRSG
jgi:hypothetical protein